MSVVEQKVPPAELLERIREIGTLARKVWGLSHLIRATDLVAETLAGAHADINPGDLSEQLADIKVTSVSRRGLPRLVVAPRPGFHGSRSLSPLPPQ